MNEIVDEEGHHDGPCCDHRDGFPRGDLLVGPLDGILNEGADDDAGENIEFEEKNRIENDAFYCVQFTINIFSDKFKSCRNDTIFGFLDALRVGESRRVS